MNDGTKFAHQSEEKLRGEVFIKLDLLQDAYRKDGGTMSEEEWLLWVAVHDALCDLAAHYEKQGLPIFKH